MRTFTALISEVQVNDNDYAAITSNNYITYNIFLFE